MIKQKPQTISSNPFSITSGFVSKHSYIYMPWALPTRRMTFSICDLFSFLGQLNLDVQYYIFGSCLRKLYLCTTSIGNGRGLVDHHDVFQDTSRHLLWRQPLAVPMFSDTPSECKCHELSFVPTPRHISPSRFPCGSSFFHVPTALEVLSIFGLLFVSLSGSCHFVLKPHSR